MVDSLNSSCRTLAPIGPACLALATRLPSIGSEPSISGATEPAPCRSRELRFHNIAITIDDLGAEWPALIGLNDFPFPEVKVDRKFISGCADDRLKRAMCGRIPALANGYGARCVAEGVETRADFLAVREMGFDLVQGFLFAKPIPAKKFARTIMGRPMTVPQ